VGLYIEVPYEENDQAQEKGAIWDDREKMWFVQSRDEYSKFIKWINGNIIALDEFFIIKGNQKCFRCGQVTPVIAFGFEKYYAIDTIEDTDKIIYSCENILISDAPDNIPPHFKNLLHDNFNFYWDLSKTINKFYNSNHCQYCSVIQGNYYLFNEDESPFFIDGIEQAEKLIVYRINIENDIPLIVNSETFNNFIDKTFKQHLHYVNTNWNWE